MRVRRLMADQRANTKLLKIRYSTDSSSIRLMVCHQFGRACKVSAVKLPPRSTPNAAKASERQVAGKAKRAPDREAMAQSVMLPSIQGKGRSRTINTKRSEERRVG